MVAEMLTGEAVTYEQVRHLNREAPGVVKFLRSAARNHRYRRCAKNRLNRGHPAAPCGPLA